MLIIFNRTEDVNIVWTVIFPSCFCCVFVLYVLGGQKVDFGDFRAKPYNIIQGLLLMLMFPNKYWIFTISKWNYSCFILRHICILHDVSFQHRHRNVKHWAVLFTSVYNVQLCGNGSWFGMHRRWGGADWLRCWEHRLRLVDRLIQRHNGIASAWLTTMLTSTVITEDIQRLIYYLS